ncbi:hypothetical protein V6N13_039689 [Hibiscus sabdariffa]
MLNRPGFSSTVCLLGFWFEWTKRVAVMVLEIGSVRELLVGVSGGLVLVVGNGSVMGLCRGRARLRLLVAA